MSDSKKPPPMPTGPERKLQIYAQGLAGGKPSVPVPLELRNRRRSWRNRRGGFNCIGGKIPS
jgi:hypothetical protein